ncbi:hypothetical protein [Arthrobacter sp. RIT-PI-e]|uniref:hypothetical protein n=1 Tax=Arthrobacter sp. RIT-PI-e TaxID=1681197 RepID=UPI002E145106
MQPAVEDVVEAIAQRLGRGLSLEDPDGVLLAYSSQQATADRVRANFLLSKQVPADVSEWQLRHGTARAVRPVVVPANQDLGMLGRVCVPLLVRGFRVGYLWVQQQSEDDPPEDILSALPAARPALDRLAGLLPETTPASSAPGRGGRPRSSRRAAGSPPPSRSSRGGGSPTTPGPGASSPSANWTPLRTVARGRGAGTTRTRTRPSCCSAPSRCSPPWGWRPSSSAPRPRTTRCSCAPRGSAPRCWGRCRRSTAPR